MLVTCRTTVAASSGRERTNSLLPLLFPSSRWCRLALHSRRHVFITGTLIGTVQGGTARIIVVLRFRERGNDGETGEKCEKKKCRRNARVSRANRPSRTAARAGRGNEFRGSLLSLLPIAVYLYAIRAHLSSFRRRPVDRSALVDTGDNRKLVRLTLSLAVRPSSSSVVPLLVFIASRGQVKRDVRRVGSGLRLLP